MGPLQAAGNTGPALPAPRGEGEKLTILRQMTYPATAQPSGECVQPTFAH